VVEFGRCLVIINSIVIDSIAIFIIMVIVIVIIIIILTSFRAFFASNIAKKLKNSYVAHNHSNNMS